MCILFQPKPPPLPGNTRLVQFGEDGRPRARPILQTRVTDNVPAYRLTRAMQHFPHEYHGGHEHVVPLRGGELLLKTILEPEMKV